MEALLKEQGEGLSFRIAQRAANLIGFDQSSRTSLYRELKELYSLRSKVVHGSHLSPKQRENLARIGDLREIVREVILAVLGLMTEFDVGEKGYYAARDEMALNDQTRDRMHNLAPRHLLVPEIPGTH